MAPATEGRNRGWDHAISDVRGRQTSGKKTWVDIIDIIVFKSLGKNVREQADIDKFMVETLEGTKNEWEWSKAKLGANTLLAISMTVKYDSHLIIS